MISESDCDCCGSESGYDCCSESETESRASSVHESMWERWESVAAMAAPASRMGRLEVLDTVLPHFPDCPQASALEPAILNSNDLQTTLRAVEKAALAMARAEELVQLA